MAQQMISPELLEKSISEKIKLLGVGDRYADAELSRCRIEKEIKGYFQNLKDNFKNGKGLLIAGPVGVGKTSALIVILKNILKASSWRTGIRYWGEGETEYVGDVFFKTCAFSTSNQIFNGVFDKKWEFLENLRTVDFLFIDDFGREHFTEYAFTWFEDLIDFRYANKKPMYITTNLPTKELLKDSKFLRVSDRWKECCEWFQITGASMRSG